jgi:hypothetical protein
MAGVGADLAFMADVLPFIIGIDAFGLDIFLDVFDGCMNMVLTIAEIDFKST